MTKALRLAAAVAVAVAAVVALLLFVQSRDRSTLSDDETNGSAPGRLLPDQGAEHRRAPAGFHYASDPPASGPHLPVPVRRESPLTRDQLLHALEAGDVVLMYGAAGDEPALRTLQEDASGPFDPTLAAAGQAVLVARRPATKGVIAVAWRRLLQVPSAGDARLRAFTDHWLGRGAPQ